MLRVSIFPEPPGIQLRFALLTVASRTPLAADPVRPACGRQRVLLRFGRRRGGVVLLVEHGRELRPPEQDDHRRRDPEQEEEDRGQRALEDLAQDDADRREVDDVEGEGPLEDLEEQGGDGGRDEPRPGVDLDLRDELVKDEEHQEGQDVGDDVFQQDVVDGGHGLGVERGPDELALLEGPAEGRPDGRHGQREEHEDADDEHHQELDEPVVEEGPVVLRPEDLVDRRDEAREEEAGRDERADDAEKPELADGARQVAEALEEARVEPGEELVGEDVEAPQGHLRVAQEPRRRGEEQGDQGDGAEQSEIGDDDGRGPTLVPVEPPEGRGDERKRRTCHPLRGPEGPRPLGLGHVIPPLDHQDDDGDEQGVNDQRLDEDEAEDEEERGCAGAPAGFREIPSQAVLMALAWQKAPAIDGQGDDGRRRR